MLQCWRYRIMLKFQGTKLQINVRARKVGAPYTKGLGRKYISRYSYLEELMNQFVSVTIKTNNTIKVCGRPAHG